MIVSSVRTGLYLALNQSITEELYARTCDNAMAIPVLAYLGSTLHSPRYVETHVDTFVCNVETRIHR